MVTEIIQYPRKKIVRVITVAGKDMSMWYEFLPMLEGYAVRNGCSSLEAWTRKGMTRKLKDWKHSYDIINTLYICGSWPPRRKKWMFI